VLLNAVLGSGHNSVSLKAVKFVLSIFVKRSHIWELCVTFILILLAFVVICFQCVDLGLITLFRNDSYITCSEIPLVLALDPYKFTNNSFNRLRFGLRGLFCLILNGLRYINTLKGYNLANRWLAINFGAHLFSHIHYCIFEPTGFSFERWIEYFDLVNRLFSSKSSSEERDGLVIDIL